MVLEITVTCTLLFSSSDSTALFNQKLKGSNTTFFHLREGKWMTQYLHKQSQGLKDY